MAKICVAVIFGGTSAQHDFSLASATNIIKYISKDKYEVVCIGITKKGRWLYYPGSPEFIEDGSWEANEDCTPAILSPDPMHRGIIKVEGEDISIKRIDIIFSVLHGKNGEDGAIQGLMTLSKIPFVGCDIAASSLCRDKAATYAVLKSSGFRIAPWDVFLLEDLDRLDERCDELIKELGLPLCVKPANGGDTINTKQVKNFEELRDAIKLAFTRDDRIVIRKFIDGKELETAVLGYKNPVVSVVGEVDAGASNYNSKHLLNDGVLHTPANIDKEDIEKIRNTALRAYKTMGCNGLAMFDFFYNEKGEYFINKINTMPGFTNNSPYPQLMEYSGVSSEEIINTLIEDAIEKANGQD